MAWALANHAIVLTHDLDFGTTLALTQAKGPSVVQVRIENPLPEHAGLLVLGVLRRYRAEFKAGALAVVDPLRSRVRVLPL